MKVQAYEAKLARMTREQLVSRLIDDHEVSYHTALTARLEWLRGVLRYYDGENDMNERLTIGDLRRHRGRIEVWVNVFGDDGEYVEVSKAALLRACGADVPYSSDGLHDSTPLASGSRVSCGVLYIN